MIDVTVQGKNGTNMPFKFPMPLKKLKKFQEKLGESGWQWSIGYIGTDSGCDGVNRVLHNHNQPNTPDMWDDIREINLLSYLLSRMDDEQRESLNADIWDYRISTYELICRAYYHADEYFSDGVTDNNKPVLYCDYECPYSGENVETMLQQEDRQFRQRQKQAEEAGTDVTMGGI